MKPQCNAGGHWRDLMDGAARIETQVHEHGHVALVDCMPRLVWIDHDQFDDIKTADAAIVQAARVSYQKGTQKVSKDRGLVRFLMRHHHNTPIEMVETKWHCKMPIFVARQWIRHRTASVNEVSARYSEMPGEYYVPAAEEVRAQGKGNKQVAEGEVSVKTGEQFSQYIKANSYSRHGEYQHFLSQGVGREMARMSLPINLYTEWYWKIDLHNLFHFLSLRMDKHAQKEIRDFAVPMFEILQTIAPVACEAFEDFRLNSLTLSGPEVAAIRNGNLTVGTNDTENQEYAAKLARLGLVLSGAKPGDINVQL